MYFLFLVVDSLTAVKHPILVIKDRVLKIPDPEVLVGRKGVFSLSGEY